MGKHLILFILSISIFGCSYNPKKLTPHFIDADRMTTREYKVVETKPEIVFEYVKENPLKKAVVDNKGLLCLPVPQALEIKRKWENRKNNNYDGLMEVSDVVNSFKYNNKVSQDLEILSGVSVDTEEE